MKRILAQQVKGVKAIEPQAATADVNGEIIDRDGAREAIVTLVTGNVSGTPTTTAVKAVIYHGDKADGSDLEATTVESAVIGVDGVAELHVDLNGVGRYIRVVADVVFTGGTSPSVQVAATAVLGNYDIAPGHRGDGETLVYGRYAGDGKGYDQI